MFLLLLSVTESDVRVAEISQQILNVNVYLNTIFFPPNKRESTHCIIARRSAQIANSDSSEGMAVLIS